MELPTEMMGERIDPAHFNWDDNRHYQTEEIIITTALDAAVHDGTMTPEEATECAQAYLETRGPQ